VSEPAARSTESRPAGLVVPLAALLAWGCGAAPRPGTPPRDVVLLTIEGLRADHCGMFGYPRETTFERRPEEGIRHDLDRVAQAGVLLAGAFAPSPRARESLSILLGAAGGGAPALASAFAAAGFETAAFCTGEEAAGLAAGFSASQVEAEDRATLGAAHLWVRERRQRPAGRPPFLLWVHLARPAPPLGDEVLADPYLDPERVVSADHYDADLRATNALVRSFVGVLEVLDPAAFGRTLLVVAGTQGAALDPAEDELSDALLHVPLVFRHPQSLTGSRVLEEVVELADVGPTLCEWLEIALPPGLRGRSLLALFDSHVERELEHRPALAVAGERWTVRSARWRLFEPEGALYDVERDPAMESEVSAQHPDVVARLRAQAAGRGSGEDG